MTSSVRVHIPREDDPLIPLELGDIQRAIQEAQTILDLQDDWDGEGSAGYAASTLKRASEFVLDNALRLWRSQRLHIPAPVIGPGPDGSIDIHWQLATRTLLVNVPANADKPATFYGSDRTSRDKSARNVIEGFLDTSVQHQWLLMWLIA
ncbi:MAG: hypothetical protein M3Y74_16985 [Chloroflexota bacterium]|nr:hypothetical protein [Chloroflexota bacterium]